jgi:hypothetical protein
MRRWFDSRRLHVISAFNEPGSGRTGPGMTRGGTFLGVGIRDRRQCALRPGRGPITLREQRHHATEFSIADICLSSEREQQVSARADCPVRCGTGNELQPDCPTIRVSGYPGIRVRPWAGLPVDVRCSDTVAGRRRDGASKRSRRGAPYCQRRPILTPGALESVRTCLSTVIRRIGLRSRVRGFATR